MTAATDHTSADALLERINHAQAQPATRRVSPDDLAELRAAHATLRKAQRRFGAVRAKIADDYDVEPDEGVNMTTGEIAPVPEQNGARD